MQAGHETARQSSDIPTLNVIVAVWWRLIDDADSGWRAADSIPACRREKV